MRNDWPAAAQLRDTSLEAESPSARSTSTPVDVERDDVFTQWLRLVRRYAPGDGVKYDAAQGSVGALRIRANGACVRADVS